MNQIVGYKLWPKAFPGESRGGYLLRMAERNGARGLAHFGRPFNLRPSQMVILGPEQVMPVLRGLPYSIEWLSWRPQDLGRALSVAGGTLRSRVCPVCIGSDPEPYLRSVWEMPLGCFCEKHLVWLQDHCEVCGRVLSLNRRSIAFCNCGASFASFSAVPVSTWAVTMLEIFIKAGDPARSATFALSTSTERIAGRLLRTISNQMSGTDPHGFGDGILERNRIDSLRPWFGAWPQSFIEAVSALRIIYGSPKWGTISRLFGARQFPSIRNAIEEAKFSEPILNHQLAIVVSSKEAVRVTGLKRDAIRHAIQKGRIPGFVQSTAGGRVSYTLSVASLKTLEDAFAQNVGVADAAVLAGCSTKLLVWIAKAKRTFILPLGVTSYSRMRLDRSEVTQYAARLCSIAVPKRIDVGLRVGLADLSRANDAPSSSRAFGRALAAIEERRLPLYSIAAGPTRLDQLYVSAIDLNRMRYRRSRQS